MKTDHVAINAVSMEEEIYFFVGFLGMKLLQIWEEPRQGYVEFDDGPVLGIIENVDFDGEIFSMAHIAFNVSEEDFENWFARVNQCNINIVSGPKKQRGGKTILFRKPSKNIVEICYPDVRKTITSQIL